MGTDKPLLTKAQDPDMVADPQSLELDVRLLGPQSFSLINNCEFIRSSGRHHLDVVHPFLQMLTILPHVIFEGVEGNVASVDTYFA